MALRIRRLHVLLAVFAGGGALIVLAPPAKDTTQVSAPSNRSRVVGATTAASSDAGGERLLAVVPRTVAASGATSSARIDPFSDRRLPPAAPPALGPALQTSQAMVAVAPPLSFTVIGKKLEAGSWEVYLMRGDATFVARKGERLDSVYLIDSIVPPVMMLTYLPIKTVQNLQIGEAP